MASFTPPAGDFVISDASASAGSALLMSGNGTATKKVTSPAATRIDVRAYGDACKGSQQMVVCVDGARLI